MSAEESPKASGDDEIRAIQAFYTESFLPKNPWVTIAPHPYLCLRQRHRRLRETLLALGFDSAEKLRSLRALDIGSGSGGNLAWLIELGAKPENLVGIDLVAARVAVAESRMSSVKWLTGDITKADVGGPFDLTLLVGVLSSCPSADLRERVVRRSFELLDEGGALFFYDLIGKHPKRGNKDVRPLSFDELEGYLGGRTPHYFARRDYLRRDVADKIVAKLGVTAAEVIQATGLWNMEAAFAWIRK